jgi:tetratricopeptide (TPR) repeat protein
MRVSTGVLASLAALVLSLAAPRPAAAEGGQSWQVCIGPTSAPDERVRACSTVIEAGSETGRKLAAAYCNRGHGLTEKRELDAALADLDEAIKLDPSYACAFNNRGRVYAFKRDFDRAITEYDQAIKLDPPLALAYNNRGDARFNKGDVNGALVDFDAAIKIDPKLAVAYGNRGYAYYRKRDTAMQLPTTPRRSSLLPIRLPISTAATPIATPSNSTALRPTMAR